MNRASKTDADIQDILGGFMSDVAQSVMTDEQVAEKEKQIKAEKEKELLLRAEERVRAFESGRVPRRLDDFRPESWSEGFIAAGEIAQGVHGNINWLFAAPTGRGKTWLAQAAAVELIYKGKRAFYLLEPKFRDEWRRSNSGDRKVFDWICSEAESADILIVDELGKTGALAVDSEGDELTPFGNAWYLIFNARYAAEKPTITCTQAGNEKDLIRRIGASLYRRVVREMDGVRNCKIVTG